MLPSLALLALAVTPIVAQCTSDLLIDDFSKFVAAGYTNNIGGRSADDGSSTAKTASTGVLNVTAKAGGGTYWYFSGMCGKTGTAGTYGGVLLTVKPPAGVSSISLNLKTASSCTAAPTLNYVTVPLTPGVSNTVRVPFSSFTGANLANIVSLNVENFGTAALYTFGPIRFYCSAGGTSTASSTSSTVSSTVLSSTSVVTTPVSTTPASSSSILSTSTTPASSTTSTSAPVATSCLVIDDFSNFKTSSNSLGGYSSDDGSFTAKSSPAVGQLLLTAKTGTSYYYFGGLCGTQAGNIGSSTSYTGVYFTVTPPVANAALQVNLKSSTSCSTAASNAYYTVQLGAAGVPSIVQIPFTAFGSINTAFITSLNLEGFSVAGQYKIGPISYYCGSPPAPTSTTPPSSSTASPTPTNLYPITKDGTCGPRSLDANGVMYRCPTSGNVCCSDTGMCGNNLAACGITFYGCRAPFGQCSGPQPQPAPNSYPAVSPSKTATWITKCTSPGLFALTYDDGPSTLVGQLLTVLANNNVKATFFINAYNRADITVDPFKTFLINAYNAGHQIASHTYDHLDMTKLDTQGNWAQMLRNDKAIAGIIGKMPLHMRPPFGAYNSATLDMIGSWGYKAVWQNIDSLDFQYSGQPDALQKMQASYDGSLQFTSSTNTSFISLQHDFVPETVASWTQRVIDQMKARGYRFVTVGECLGEPNPANWYRDVSQWPQWA